MPELSVVVGNPKAGSRTRRLAEEVARQVGDLVPPSTVSVIELADVAGELFDWSSATVKDLVDQVLAADGLIVASPTFKATFTGLLKAFLDRFGADELAAKPTVPVMTGGNAGHSLAVEHTLRPLLVEIGASTPTRGLYVTEAEIEDPAVPVRSWLDVWGGALTKALA